MMIPCTSRRRRKSHLTTFAFLLGLAYLAQADSASAIIVLPLEPSGDGPIEVSAYALDNNESPNTVSSGQSGQQSLTSTSVVLGRSSALASADFGILRASAATTEYDASNAVEASAKAFFEDSISVPSPSGTALEGGFLRLDFRLTGTLNGGTEGSSYASASFDLAADVPGDGASLVSGPAFSVEEHFFAEKQTDESEMFDQIISLTFPITFDDSPTNIAAALSVYALHGGSADFGNTAKLNAVVLTESNSNGNNSGIAIPDFVITSAKNIDYLSIASVPEPSSMLFFSMLTMLYGCHRSRC